MHNWVNLNYNFLGYWNSSVLARLLVRDHHIAHTVYNCRISWRKTERKTNTESFKLKRLVIRWRLRNVGFDMQTMASYNGAEPTAFKDFIWFSPFLTSHCGVSAQQYNLDGLRVKAKHFRSLKWHRFRDFIPFCVFQCRLLRLQKTLVFWRTWEEQVSYFSHWSLSLLIKKWFDIEMILRKKPRHGFVIWFASFLRFGWKEIVIFTFYIITIFTVS